MTLARYKLIHGSSLTTFILIPNNPLICEEKFTSCKAFGLETFRWTTQHFYIIIILHLQNLWTFLACNLMVVQVWFFWCWSNIIESTWGHKRWCCLCYYYKCKFAQYNYRGYSAKKLLYQCGLIGYYKYM